MIVRILIFSFLLHCFPFTLFAQQDQKKADDQAKSPVFKSYKPPPGRAALQGSDLIYESWQAFITERRAVAGDPAAQHEIGLRYLLGRGVEADTARGAYWIARAAAQNVVSARFNLGILDYHGWGVPWNPFESFTQFHWCAEHGMVEAELTLGEFYTENLIVPVNWDTATYWIQKAVQDGYAPAKQALEEVRKRSERNRRDEAADSALAKVDSSGMISKTLSIAPVFLAVEEDTASRSSEWKVLRGALEEADPEVREALGISRIIDENLDLDSLGIEYIKRAANGGNPEALKVLGRCYERGIRVREDEVTAASLYIRAIRMESPQAGILLFRLAQRRAFLTSLKSRAEHGDDEARFAWAGLLGLGFGGLLYQGQAYLTDRQALDFLEAGDSHRYLPSTIELGLCYYAGRWVSQDENRAKELWWEASAAGSKEAEVRLAAVSVRAESDPDSLARVIDTLQRAIHDGSLLAEIALGYCFETGTGVPKNESEAARLYTNGARRGSQDAYRALRRMLDAIRPAGKEFRMEE